MWDVFISYAREDEEDYAHPLMLALSTLDIKFWYDNHRLLLGDSIQRSIKENIEQSTYGIALLSDNYFKEEKKILLYTN